MSFRGRGGSPGRGRGGRPSFGGGAGGAGMDLDNPDQVVEFGTFVHTAAENMLVFKQLNHEKVPKFNAPLFSANKQKIGIIDEIFGPINEVYCSAKPAAGIQGSSFKAGDKCFISPERLLFADMFDESKQTGGGRGGRGGRGGSRGGSRGGGAPRGGSFRGGSRGGSFRGAPRGGGGRGGSRGRGGR